MVTLAFWIALCLILIPVAINLVAFIVIAIGVTISSLFKHD